MARKTKSKMLDNLEKKIQEQKETDLLHAGDAMAKQYAHNMLGINNIDDGWQAPNVENENMKHITLEDKIQEKGKKNISTVKIAELSKSPKNHYKKLKEDDFNELKASIENNGLQTPIIIRPKELISSYEIENKYEILAGHNRVEAFKELNKEEIEAIIVDANDEKAVTIINDTNLQRTEISTIEKAWAYREMFDIYNKNGKNNYNKEDFDNLSRSSEENELTTEKIGKMYNVSSRTIERFIRFTYLISDILNLYETKKITQAIALELSYLTKKQQEDFFESYKMKEYKITSSGVKTLRKICREKDEIKRAEIDECFAQEQNKEPKKKKMKSYKIADELFPANIESKEREKYIIKALRYIIENEISLESENK